MMIKQSLFSESLFMVISIYLFATITTTILAQSPAAAPGQSVPILPQRPAQAPAMVTIPIGPVSPTIAAPSPAEAPTTPSVDIIKILKKVKRFSVLIRLLKTTQLINQLNSQLLTTNDGGVTIFAPDDSAFSKLKSGFLNSLNDQQKVELLQFHILSSVISLSNFDTLTNPVRTQAGDNPTRLGLNVTAYGDQVSMTTGVVTTKISGTVYTDNKLAIYQVDKVLLPLDFFTPKPRAPAPSPSKAVAESPGNSGKEKSTDEDNSDTDTNAVSVDKSASVNSTMHRVWHFLLVVIALSGIGSIYLVASLISSVVHVSAPPPFPALYTLSSRLSFSHSETFGCYGFFFTSSASWSLSATISLSPVSLVICGRGDRKTAKGKRFNHSFGNARPRDKKKGRGPPRIPLPPSPPKEENFEVEVEVEDQNVEIENLNE